MASHNIATKVAFISCIAVAQYHNDAAYLGVLMNGSPISLTGGGHHTKPK